MPIQAPNNLPPIIPNPTCQRPTGHMAMRPPLALHLGRVLRRRAGAAADAQLALLPAAARLLEGTLPGG